MPRVSKGPRVSKDPLGVIGSKIQKNTKKKSAFRKLPHQKKNDSSVEKKVEEKTLQSILDDLDHSYVGEIPSPPKEPKPPRHKRLKNTGKESLEADAELPEDWTDSEPDLSDDDFESQIERARERIEDNIRVDTFRDRLEELEDKLQHRNELINAEPEGLSWPVILRLQSLDKIKGILEELGDPDVKLRSLKAIIAAYRTGQLEWHDGLCTYWSQGRQVSQPRPHDLHEAVLLSNHFANQDGFLVEGGSSGPGPATHYIKFSLPPDRSYYHYKKFSVSIEGHAKTMHLDFMDDTGCSDILLYENDVLSLMDVAPGAVRPAAIPQSMIHGYQITIYANGSHGWSKQVALEIGMSHLNRTMIPPKKVLCSIFSHALSRGRHGPPRLMGNFFRSMLYTASAPDNRNRIFVSNNRDELVGMIPEPDITQARPRLLLH